MLCTVAILRNTRRVGVKKLSAAWTSPRLPDAGNFMKVMISNFPIDRLLKHWVMLPLGLLIFCGKGHMAAQHSEIVETILSNSETAKMPTHPQS
jgi:hypothetical protein